MPKMRNKVRNKTEQQREKEAKQEGQGRALAVSISHVFGVLVAFVAHF